MIRNYKDADGLSVLSLWNSAGAVFGYAPQDLDGLKKLILQHPDFSVFHSFVLEEDGAVCGFISGCTGDHLARGAERGYLSCLLLAEEYNDPEHTVLLLEALENSFRAK